MTYKMLWTSQLGTQYVKSVTLLVTKLRGTKCSQFYINMHPTVQCICLMNIQTDNRNVTESKKKQQQNYLIQNGAR